MAQIGGFWDSLTRSGRFAMQKVVGSSPIIRSQKPRPGGVSFFSDSAEAERIRSGCVAVAGLKVAVDQRLGELPLPTPEFAPVRLELEVARAMCTHHLPFGDEQSNSFWRHSMPAVLARALGACPFEVSIQLPRTPRAVIYSDSDELARSRARPKE